MAIIRETSKIAHEWNSHLEILNCSKAIENSGQHLLLRTDILQKTVVGSGSFRGLYRPTFSTQRHSSYNRKVRHVKPIMAAPKPSRCWRIFVVMPRLTGLALRFWNILLFAKKRQCLDSCKKLLFCDLNNLSL